MSNSLASTLRVERARRRLSAEQLAKKSGVSRVTIARIESVPDYTPTLPTLVAISKALGISLERLINSRAAA